MELSQTRFKLAHKAHKNTLEVCFKKIFTTNNSCNKLATTVKIIYIYYIYIYIYIFYKYIYIIIYYIYIILIMP